MALAPLAVDVLDGPTRYELVGPCSGLSPDVEVLEDTRSLALGEFGNPKRILIPTSWSYYKLPYQKIKKPIPHEEYPSEKPKTRDSI